MMVMMANKDVKDDDDDDDDWSEHYAVEIGSG